MIMVCLWTDSAFLLVILITISFFDLVQPTASADSNHYCMVETFEANCPQDELIVITKAVYGFMGKGRCVKFDSGVPCILDAMPFLQRECAWKNQCSYLVGQKELEDLDECLKEVRPYLIAEYTCMAVESNPKCPPMTPQRVSHDEGSMSSAIARQTGCGSLLTPWRFELLPGQSITFDLLLFAEKQNDTYREDCIALGFIYNRVTKSNTTICEQVSNQQPFFTSAGHNVDLQIITTKELSNDFIINYKVSGCIDLLTPEFAWYTRTGDAATIGCLYRNMSWQLHCMESNWQGVVGKCPNAVTPTSIIQTENNTPRDYKFLILICVTAVIFILLIMCSVIGIVKYFDHKKCKPTKQVAIPMDATCHRYSGEPQRPLMYGGVDVVPDLLESSLQRPSQRHMAESECSSQTYYPGTMYFMGAQGHPMPSSQPDVPIPLPPTSKSDSESESEHVYDKIPCD